MTVIEEENILSMAGKEENPLLATLPPATDYIGYLTIVEHNLTEELLPSLHDVLQDSELTINIGWDLVQILLPLLPASEQCLQDIARLGNPREVVLKVTEALRVVHWDDADEVDEDLDEEDQVVAAAENRTETSIDEAPAPTAPEGVPESQPTDNQTTEKTVKVPLPVLQFQTLLSMLAVLHPRIKTKYPSRFLSTSLQAVLASYQEATSYTDELTVAILRFIKTVSGTKRPHLPSRSSSSQLLTQSSIKTAPDPEAETQSEGPTSQEKSLLNRLHQSFLTHVFEEYMLSFPSIDDLPALAWSGRLLETLHPERNIPGKPTIAERFASDDSFQSRRDIVGDILALARDLNIEAQELLDIVRSKEPEAAGEPKDEDDPPASAADIPLSKTGALFLLTARAVSGVLFDRPLPLYMLNQAIFPMHAVVLANFIGSEPVASIGTEPVGLLDTILSLGLLAVSNDNVGVPESDEQFLKYLQILSLISANCPNPMLRYHAHYLTSTILRSHPHDLVRLQFVRDTLEHCPYDNLKVSAVSWLKGETIEANHEALGIKQLLAQSPAESKTAPPESSTTTEDAKSTSASSKPTPTTTEPTETEEHTSIFATPIALHTLAPSLFPSLSLSPIVVSIDASSDTPASSSAAPAKLLDSWPPFAATIPLHLAVLNFYYFLLRAPKALHEALDVAGLHEEADVGGSYLGPLHQICAAVKTALEGAANQELDEGEREVMQMDIMLLEDALGRVTQGVANLNTE